MSDSGSRESGGGAAWIKLAALVVVVAAGTWFGTMTPVGQWLGRDGIGRGIEWLRAADAAPLVYIAVYAAATAVAIPGSVLTMAGGAVFGVFGGTLYTTLGANIGANIAFGLARSLGREGVTKLARDRLGPLDRATEAHGFIGLLTLRLIPVVPFNALNFGSGLTSMRWRSYAAATAIGIFPGTFVYTLFADALLTGSQEASREALVRVLLSGLLLVTLSMIPALARRLGLRLPGAALLGGLFAAGLSGPVVAQESQLPDHAVFDALLADVVRQPLVDYSRLAEERSRLDGYLAELGVVDAGVLGAAPETERLAFWINAYNACMLRLVVDHYPIEPRRGLVSRLKNAAQGRPANSVWQIPDVFTGAHCRVAGALRSQDEIEHELIRPIGDPRIHFAVNCAARSCPPLWPEAYHADDLDAQLERAVDYLTSHQEHLALEDGVLRLNKVLDWYNEDFGGIQGLREFLAPYLAADLARAALDPAVRVTFFDYDWTLNDTSR